MSQRRRQNHFWQKVPSPQAKNARVGMSRPHTSLTTAVVLIFPQVCGFCRLFPSLLNLALPSWIHSVPPLFALVSEGNSSRQKGSVCVVYSRVELRLICILTWVLNVCLNWRGAAVHSGRALMWDSCGSTLSPAHTAPLFLCGWIWSSTKMKGSKSIAEAMQYQERYFTSVHGHSNKHAST